MATARARSPRPTRRAGLELRHQLAACRARRRRQEEARTHQGRLPSAMERQLVLAAKAGDSEARRELIEALRPFIAGVARHYRGSTSVDQAELMQEGVVGVLRALARYDPGRANPFWAYASWWVRQAMQHLVAELTRPVVLSDRASRQLARIKRAQQERLQSQGSEPTLAQLARDTQLSQQQVGDLMAAERHPRGLDEPIRSDQREAATFGEQLADPRAEDEYDRIPQRLGIEELRNLLPALSRRERAILGARHGLNGRERTLSELGSDLGVSAERVRQIEQAALDKLRAAAAA
jgi:RNA polymerase primary sigma factor